MKNNTEYANEAIRFRVNTNGGLQKSLRFGLYKKQGTTVYDWDGVMSGYYIEFNATNKIMTIFCKNDNTLNNKAFPNGFPEDWIMEYGVAQVRKAGEVVGRKIYIKMDNVEVLSYVESKEEYETRLADTTNKHSMGTYLPAMTAGSVTLESCYTVSNPDNSDLFDWKQSTSMTNTPDSNDSTTRYTQFGNMKNTTASTYGDEAIKAHVTPEMETDSTLKGILRIGLYKTTPYIHNGTAQGSGYFFEFSTSNTIGFYIGDQYKKGINYTCPTEFDMECGVANIYDVDGTTIVARKIYLMIDNEEKLSYIDYVTDYDARVSLKDTNFPNGYAIGNNLTVYYIGNMTFESKELRVVENTTGTIVGGTKPVSVPAGFNFAGYYKNYTPTGQNVFSEPLKSGEAVDTTQTKVYAKFVTEDVFTVKVQNGADNDTKGHIRFLSTVDSLNYKEVGFKFTLYDADGKIIPDKQGNNEVVMSTKTVYTTVRVMGEENVTPQTFSDASTYFFARTIKNIPNGKIEVTPYHVTQDGTMVEGKMRTLNINASAAQQ